MHGAAPGGFAFIGVLGRRVGSVCARAGLHEDMGGGDELDAEINNIDQITRCVKKLMLTE